MQSWMKTAPPQREKRKSSPSQPFINLVPDTEWLIALTSKLIYFVCWWELMEELVTEQGLRCYVHFPWPLSTRRGAELGPWTTKPAERHMGWVQCTLCKQSLKNMKMLYNWKRVLWQKAGKCCSFSGSHSCPLGRGLTTVFLSVE